MKALDSAAWILTALIIAAAALWRADPASAQVPPGNAWNNVAVALNGVSAPLNMGRCPYGVTTAFGNTSGAATLTVQYSQDNVTFASSATNTGAVTGNFGISFQHGARFVRLTSNAAVTITATLSCK